MNPQLIKEFRALVVPWSVAILAAILRPMGNFLVGIHMIEGGTFLDFLFGIVGFAFFLSLLTIAAFPIGTEFQHRTFSLLLSQPIARSVIWRHKLIAASLGMASALLVFALSDIVAKKGAIAAMTPNAVATAPITTEVEPTTVPSVPGGMTPEQAEMYQRRYGVHPGIRATQSQSPSAAPTEDVLSVWEICLTAAALLWPTLGSVTFWTLVARSTLGGMVFTAFSELIALGIVAFVLERLGISTQRLGFRDFTTQPFVFVLASIIYGGVFFRLSWRRFSRFDFGQLLPDTLAGSKSLSAAGLRIEILRCRPASGLVNLIRKEIHLQRPVVIIAGIMCLAWAPAYAFLISKTRHTAFPEIVFALTIGFYMPLISFLAGSVSLGEEKNLGITAWHLTFPVSVWRQWSVKLGVGLVTWILLGLLLPFGLTRLGLAMRGPRIFTELELKS